MRIDYILYKYRYGLYILNWIRMDLVEVCVDIVKVHSFE